MENEKRKTERKEFDTNHFIMCPKSIIYEYDILTACLYGLIWSFSQMDLGYCKISQRQMANKLGCKTRCINSKFANLKQSQLIFIIGSDKYPDGGVNLHVKCNPHELKMLDKKYINKFQKNSDNDDLYGE